MVASFEGTLSASEVSSAGPKNPWIEQIRVSLPTLEVYLTIYNEKLIDLKQEGALSREYSISSTEMNIELIQSLIDISKELLKIADKGIDLSSVHERMQKLQQRADDCTSAVRCNKELLRDNELNKHGKIFFVLFLICVFLLMVLSYIALGMRKKLYAAALQYAQNEAIT